MTRKSSIERKGKGREEEIRSVWPFYTLSLNPCKQKKTSKVRQSLQTTSGQRQRRDNSFGSFRSTLSSKKETRLVILRLL